MNKVLVLLGWLVAGSMTVRAQNVFSAQKIAVSFYSSAPIEDIEASSVKGVSTIDPQTGEVIFKIPVQSFEFENKLMQRHFNSEYLETEKYPNALFRGKINDSVSYNKEGQYAVQVSGKLAIHGVTHDYTGPATLTVQNGQLQAHAEFKVRLKDYNIEIPSLLVMNIAEEVEVKVTADYGKNINSPAIK